MREENIRREDGKQGKEDEAQTGMITDTVTESFTDEVDGASCQ